MLRPVLETRVERELPGLQPAAAAEQRDEAVPVARGRALALVQQEKPQPAAARAIQLLALPEPELQLAQLAPRPEEAQRDDASERVLAQACLRQQLRLSPARGQEQAYRRPGADDGRLLPRVQAQAQRQVALRQQHPCGDALERRRAQWHGLSSRAPTAL
jgi:hypothetical protein